MVLEFLRAIRLYKYFCCCCCRALTEYDILAGWITWSVKVWLAECWLNDCNPLTSQSFFQMFLNESIFEISAGKWSAEADVKPRWFIEVIMESMLPLLPYGVVEFIEKSSKYASIFLETSDGWEEKPFKFSPFWKAGSGRDSANMFKSTWSGRLLLKDVRPLSEGE